MQAKFGSDQFTVVGLMEGDRAEAARFIKDLGANYPILTEASASFSKWGVSMIPQAYLVNPEGVVVADDADSISEILRSAL